MAMYTYINDQDIENWSKVEDGDLNQLLQEARRLNPGMLISVIVRPVRHKWYKKARYVTLYSVRYHDHRYEARIVNFAQDHSHEWSINEYVTKSYVMNYLYGYLTGFHNAKTPNT